MFAEEASNEVLIRSENRPKGENTDAGIDCLVMLFDEKTYKSVHQLFMREQ